MRGLQVKRIKRVAEIVAFNSVIWPNYFEVWGTAPEFAVHHVAKQIKHLWHRKDIRMLVFLPPKKRLSMPNWDLNWDLDNELVEVKDGMV